MLEISRLIKLNKKTGLLGKSALLGAKQRYQGGLPDTTNRIFFEESSPLPLSVLLTLLSVPLTLMHYICSRHTTFTDSKKKMKTKE